ncbi:MAG: prepilin-type N-terminal cleavage/methylation domain-containing protein, partial [bacterium]|nr:prepilin-type N-terminal cleavage/methylation domain-containing protein [bacterium]
MRGFTLIETLVAVGILALLAAIVITSLSSFQRSGELLRAADLIAGVLRDARGRTLASQNDSAYGVHFDAGSVVLFEGTIYDSGAVSNEVTLLPFRIIISEISLGGGDEVVFERLSGEANVTGTITLQIKQEPSKTKEVQVYK